MPAFPWSASIKHAKQRGGIKKTDGEKKKDLLGRICQESKRNGFIHTIHGAVVSYVLTRFVFIGAGESGKSTILKQMKLIYAQGFNKNERLDFKPVIFSNIVQSFKTISEAMAEMGYEYDSPDNEVSNFAPLCGAQAYYMIYICLLSQAYPCVTSFTDARCSPRSNGGVLHGS